MKATLLALMTLGSLAMAADITTTVAPMYAQGQGLSGSNNNQAGISFILTPEAVRYASVGEAVLPAAGTVVTLTSIEIGNGQAQGTTLRPQSNLLPIITDAEGYLVAFGNSAGVTVQRKNGTYYGGWDFTRDFTTWSSFLAPDLTTTSISLEVGEQYRIFLMDGDQSYDLMMAAAMSSGQPVEVTQNYYKDTVRYFSVGPYDVETTAQYGFINAAGTAVSTNQAPMMALTVTYTPQVPEPTTGTLSLLALAGLCIRRRK